MLGRHGDGLRLVDFDGEACRIRLNRCDVRVECDGRSGLLARRNRCVLESEGNRIAGAIGAGVSKRFYAHFDGRQILELDGRGRLICGTRCDLCCDNDVLDLSP